MLTPNQIAIVLAATTVLSAAITLALMLRRRGSAPPGRSLVPPAAPTISPAPKHGPASAAARARMIAMLEHRAGDR